MKTYIVLTKANQEGKVYIKIGTTTSNIYGMSQQFLAHNPNIAAFLFIEGDCSNNFLPLEDWWDKNEWIEISVDSYPDLLQMHLDDIIEELIDDYGFECAYHQHLPQRTPQFDRSKPYA